MIHKTLLPLAILAALVSPIVAQEAPSQIKPFRVLQFKAVSEDTAIYSPQIQDGYVFHPQRPENPIEVGVEAGTANDLLAGQVRDIARGNAGPMFPAIGATGWTPPDPDLAVGPNHIVAVVNSSLAFFNKDGTRTFMQTSQTFFSGLGAGFFLFDPKCFYDRVHNRFVIVYLEQDDSPQVSKVLVAVSDDSDPAGTWHKYRLEAKLVTGGTSYWLDYPGIGYNKDAFVVCGNMFGFNGGFAGVQFLVIPSAPLLTGGTATVRYLRDANSASVQIAETIDASHDKIYAARRDTTTSTGVYAIRDLTSMNPVITETTVAVPAGNAPQINASSTNGTQLDSLDGRIFNASWRGGKLVAAHTIQVGSFLRVRWYQFSTNTWPTSGAPTLDMAGDVGATSVHHHMGVANINSVGDVSVIFTRSSTSITADIMRAGRLVGDPIGTMGTPVNLESSSGNRYTGGRWGDYFGIDVDPVDDTTFWGIGMGVAANNDWRTSIFSWTISSPGTVVTPSALTMDRGTIISGAIGDLATSDDARVRMRPADVFATTEYAIRALINGVSPDLTPSQLKVLVESQASSGGIEQRVELFVHGTGVWEEVDRRLSTVGSDSSFEVTISTNPERFIDAAGSIRARLSYRATEAAFIYPWVSSVDRFVWTVVP
ncbi:MAG: hypothetical protein H0W86_05285 [Armatimonadetes bacterium]|nr:hypothetical protein [Armatimonadota bacterium]